MIKFAFLITLFVTTSGQAQVQQQEFASWEQACATTTSLVAEGDLIFIDIPNILFRQVAKDTGSWTSHVGIAFQNEEGNWIVRESAIPISREVSLCDYLKRSSNHLFEIRRLARPLTPEEVSLLRSTSASLLGRLYGLGFDFQSERMFCSKFTFLAYQSIGIDVGDLQTLRELLKQNPDSSLTFWRFWFLGSVPWERWTVTPASQLQDSKFVTILKGH